MIKIYNPPTDETVSRSLSTILKGSDIDAQNSSALYLAHSVATSTDLSKLIDTIMDTVCETTIFVNSLDITTSLYLQQNADSLTKKGLKFASDYSNLIKTTDDKNVFFYNSNESAPYINFIYAQVEKHIAHLLNKYNLRTAQVGSDTLKDFPCKLDVDILTCTSSQQDYLDFIDELLGLGMFHEPRKDIDDSYHRFLYGEVLGAPIDLHVVRSSLEECFLYKQIEQLKTDEAVREQYKEFKLCSAGLSISEYRKEKALFRKKVGWD